MGRRAFGFEAKFQGSPFQLLACLPTPATGRKEIMQSPPDLVSRKSRWVEPLCKGLFDSDQQRDLDDLRRSLRSLLRHLLIGERAARVVPTLHESKRPTLVLAVDEDRMGAFHHAEPCPSPLHRNPEPRSADAAAP